MAESGLKSPGIEAKTLSLNAEIETFAPVADQIALGDLAIRQRFATTVAGLFVIANLFVMVGLYFLYLNDCTLLAQKQITPDQRIIDSKVVMALLAATTVQLGTVIFTIAKAIFPVNSDK